METVEILAGSSFVNAVQDLALTSAICTYHHHPDPGVHEEDYQVWLLSEEDFRNICALNDTDWKETWGWWRHNGGYNGGAVNGEFIVNGKKLLAWDSRERENYFEEECLHCGDRKMGCCHGRIEDQDECYGSRCYAKLSVSVLHTITI